MVNATRRATIAGALAVGSQIGANAVAKEEDKKDDNLASSAAFHVDELSVANGEEDGFSMKFFDNNTLITLIYDIPVGADAPQNPHGLDELYIVMKGRSKFMAAGKEYAVEPGTVLFVKAGDEHYFKDIKEDIQAVIIFSKGDPKKPPYYERKK